MARKARPYERLALEFNRPVPTDSQQPDFLTADNEGGNPVENLPGRIQTERVLDFGDAWMGTRLWSLLGFDEFFARRFSPGREDFHGLR